MAEVGRSSEADDGKHHKQNKSNGSKRNVNQHLRVTSKGSFKWHGTFEELQVFVNEELEIQTKWSSPRGGLKLLETDDLSIRWYSTSFSLIVKGKDSEDLKEKLLLLSKKEMEMDEEHETLIDNEDMDADREEALSVEDGSKVTSPMRSVQSPADGTLNTFIKTAFKYLEEKIENLDTELNNKVNVLLRDSRHAPRTFSNIRTSYSFYLVIPLINTEIVVLLTHADVSTF